MSRLEKKRDLEEKLKGRPCPAGAAIPERLCLSLIREEPELFQFRSPMEHASRAHVAELAKVVRDGGALAPITVWWGGDGWYCIDGHHRLRAYRAGKWPHDKPVSVAVFSGTLDGALVRAVSSNAPDRLPMSKPEKTQAAWELAVTVGTSKANLARQACVSERTIASMRSIAKKLRQADPSRDLSELQWHQARREASGEEVSEDLPDWEAKTLEEAQKMADSLVRTLGKRGSERLEAFALALEIYDKRLPVFLLEHWQQNAGHLPEDFGEDEESDF